MTTFPNIKSSVKKYPFSENAFLPRIVIVPVCQEDGVVCKPLVEKGSIVTEGQVIASSGDFNGSKIHSPVPGTVLDVFTGINSNGKPSVSIKIALSGSFTFTGKKVFGAEESWTPNGKNPSVVCEKLSEFGIINTFDLVKTENLYIQIKNLSAESKTLVVRLFDEDPYRLIDSYISTKYFDQVMKGAKILSFAARLKKTAFIADSDFKADFTLSDSEKIHYVNAKKYPSGFRQELCSSFNKANKRATDSLISEKDLFVDSGTLYEVAKAFEKNMPYIEHMVHISGDCIPSSCVLNVRFGTRLIDLVNQVGGFIAKPNLLIINGHIIGNSVSSLDVPVTKTVKSICFVSARKTPEQLVYECVSCGNCRDICPRNLSPDLLYRYMDEQYPLPKEYLKTSLSCSGCGLCNSVCPSRIPLQQIINLMQEKLTEEAQ